MDNQGNRFQYPRKTGNNQNWNQPRKHNNRNSSQNYDNKQTYEKPRYGEKDGWKRNQSQNQGYQGKPNYVNPPVVVQERRDFLENISLDDINNCLDKSLHSWYDIGRVKIFPKASMGQFKQSGFMRN